VVDDVEVVVLQGRPMISFLFLALFVILLVIVEWLW
jgi:hypothetical protein